MKLSKGTIRPGTVMEVLENGDIKASVPGVFNFSDDTSKMPPIMPWFIGSNCNAFSKPKKHDEVWVMNFEDNPRQLYWFRKDKFSESDNMSELLTKGNIEILCNREVDGEWCTLYCADGSGWIMNKGDSMIRIRPNGSILLDTGFGKRCIDISPKCISLGSEGSSKHPAAYGDAVADVFMTIISTLRQIQLAASANPMTSTIGGVLAKAIPEIENKLPKIISPHVTLE